MAKRQNDTEHKISEKDLEMNPELNDVVQVSDTVLIPNEEESEKADETVKPVEKSTKKKKTLTIEGNLIISHKVENDKHILKTDNGLGYILSEDEFAAYVK